MKKIVRLFAILAAAGCVFVFSGCTLISANPTGRWSFSSEDVYFNGNAQSHVSEDDMSMKFEYVLNKDGTGQIEINGTPTYKLTYDYDDKGVTLHIDNLPLLASTKEISDGGTHDSILTLDGDNFRLGAQMINTVEEEVGDAGNGEKGTQKIVYTFTKKL